MAQAISPDIPEFIEIPFSTLCKVSKPSREKYSNPFAIAYIVGGITYTIERESKFPEPLSDESVEQGWISMKNVGYDILNN